MKQLRLLPVVFVFLIASTLSATVFQNATDRELVDRSQAVVVATVRDASSRLGADGYVVTDYHFSIEQTLKGSVGDVITVSEVGGSANGRFTFIADSAAYTPGERVLVFLKARGDGTWFTTSMAMGKFTYGRNVQGERIVRRDVSELSGDPDRLADPFERFVRDTAWGLDTADPSSYTSPFKTTSDAFHPAALSFPASAYCLSGGPDPVRWENGETGFNVMFYVTGTLTGVNHATALGDIANGLGAWTGDPNAGIVLSGGTNPPPINASAPNADDGNNVIYLGYDSTVSGVCDGAFGCTLGNGNVTHMYKGETFISISDADIVVRNIVDSSQFESLITHELGHAIGFRHSNQGTPSDSSAIMNSTINAGFGSNLQSWDHDANDTVYGNGPVCTNPGISGQPAGTTITSGQSTTLSVTATGTTPTYQWYIGNSGVTTTPIGFATSSSVNVSPTATTTYWVRVSGCSTSVNSNAATVTVNQPACVPPTAGTPNASPSSIASGQSSTVSVNPAGTSPFTYQWYIGNSGVTTTPIGGATSSFVSVSPTVTTSYWVRVTGQCLPTSDSPATTVTVTCAPINGSPSASPNPINPGQSSILSVATFGAAPFTFQWYSGNAGDTSSPINGATGASTSVSPTTTSVYWVRVTAGCGSQDASVLVTVNGPCVAPAITTQPASSTVTPSTPVTLTVAASGTAPFTYQWYIGNKSDVSNPIAGATSFSTVQSPTVTTKYWVRVSHACNSADIADSNAATITVSICVSPSITTQPAGVSVPIGEAATLKVIAAGSGLHYAWYQGQKGDTSKPTGAADSATFVSGAISGNTAFWVRATGTCGSLDSNAAIVTAGPPPRGRAVVHH